MLAAQIPQRASVLDIGCGDGTIGQPYRTTPSDISIQGVELLVRPGLQDCMRAFDGSSLPFPDASFDVCVFVDVLHHTQDLARPASRRPCASAVPFVQLKDHLDETFLDD